MATAGGAPVDVEPERKRRAPAPRPRHRRPSEPAEISQEEFEELVPTSTSRRGAERQPDARGQAEQPEPGAEPEPEPEPERDERADEVDDAAQAAVAGRREPGIMGPGGKKRRKQRRPRNKRHGRSLMGMLAWVMMGLAIWHFTIFLPDRFWGGIVGAFLGALIGAVLFGLIINGFTIPGADDTDLLHGARGDPRRADRHRPRVLRGRAPRRRARAEPLAPSGAAAANVTSRASRTRQKRPVVRA